VLAFDPASVGDCCELPPVGLRVGNRPEALPPGLSVDPVPFRYGKFPTWSGDVTSPDGTGGTLLLEVVPEVEVDEDLAGGVVTEIVSDTWGSFTTCAVAQVTVNVAVSFTDVTDVADAGTVTCAWSCRGSDAEATVFRPQDAVPSPFSQPTVN
jgi:uncharacterized protein YodC (DUF2158 family)